MKRFRRILLMIFIIMLTLCSCDGNGGNLNEIYTYYNGAFYVLHTPSNDYYESTWYPLSNDYSNETGYFCEEMDSGIDNNLDKYKQDEIKAFTDVSLSMFIKNDTFWGESLYGQVGYDFPDYNSSDVEEIIINTNNSEWTECYKDNNSVKIVMANDVLNFMNEVQNIGENQSNSKSFPVSYSLKGYEIGLKFKGINAIYYLGMIDKDENGNYYFYNANNETKESVCYRINPDCIKSYL